MMKRKLAKLLTGVLVLASSLAILTGCSGGTGYAVADNGKELEAGVDYVDGKELMCLADSREQAEAIAKQYNIELVEYSYGVATFHTDDNPNDVIALGKKLGYPELSLNGTVHAY